jgi:hypothetical protein
MQDGDAFTFIVKITIIELRANSFFKNDTFSIGHMLTK